MEKLNARLSEELSERLEEEVKKFGISKSEFIRLVLISWFSKNISI